MSEPRFCQQCGRSLIPLTTPHVSRQCKDCGQRAYFADPGKDGKGLVVEKGDSFHIPDGWLTLSLDPSKSRGTFTRTGVNVFVEHLFYSHLPTDPSQVESFLRALDKEADEVLLSSSRMPGLDLDSQDDMGRAFETFKDARDTIEWRAIMLTILAQHCLRLLTDDNCSKEDLASAIARTMATHLMLVYKQSLESHVWAGYEQTRLVYGVAAAGASTPTEALAIEALRPAFENLSEEVLAAWVGADANVGEKLGVKDIDEDIVNALAKYHLAKFERKRQEHHLVGEMQSRKWTNLIAAAAAGAAVAGVIVTLLVYLGVFASSPSTPSAPVPSAPSASVKVSSSSGESHSG